MIEIDEKLFLHDFEKFKKVIVFIVDKQRAEDGLPALSEDEQANMFIEMRKEHGIHGDPPQATG